MGHPIEQLFSNSQQRQLVILRYLLKHPNRPLNLQDIKSCADRSTPSLITYLTEFKHKFSELFNPQLTTNIVIFKNPSNLSMDRFYYLFKKESLNLLLLEYIFHHEDCSRKTICDQFFISRSTFYRAVHSINLFFEEYFPTLSLESSPCQIKGSEKIIRQFYYTYFSFEHAIFNWPLKNLRHQLPTVYSGICLKLFPFSVYTTTIPIFN